MYFEGLAVLDLGENRISGNIPEWIGENITSLLEKWSVSPVKIEGRLVRSPSYYLSEFASPGCAGDRLARVREASQCMGLWASAVLDYALEVSQKYVGGENLTTASCSEHERLALLKFKHSMEEDHGMLSSWGIGNDCCRWERVGCDDATGRVVSLHLRANYRDDYMYVDSVDNCFFVADEVNSCLTELVSLKHLDLSGNFFYTRIPEFIGSLKQLEYLNLSNTNFIGDIPRQIGNLSNLKVLDLTSRIISEPKLMTHDMAWISGLSKLEHLDLSGVNLSRAQNLDKLLYTLPSLVKLSLSDCGLSMAHRGSHHRNTSRELPSIKHLDLIRNDFRGQVPTLFLNITSLEILDLSGNDLSMVWIFKNLLNMIPFVSELHLSNCWLRKVNLSPSHFNFSTHANIQHLDLSLNEIEGRFPYILTNMSSLLSLDLSNNMLNSSIPIMPNLLRLDVSWNNFRRIEDLDQNRLNGSVPESLGRLTTLKGLDLSFNEFTGPIPEALGKLRSLQRLDLSYNQLSNSIPESLGRLSALTELFLDSNKFTGSIPTSLGGLTPLRMLSVSSNLLNETIPNSIGQLTKLYHLDYLNANHNNKLLFNISSEWIPPFQLEVVRLSSCKIEGEFPQWFRTQRKLKELVLTNASIFGPLPTWLRLLPIIYHLDLSHNKLTGPLSNLPSLYEVTDAKYSQHGLHLQDNLFEGLIPKSLCKRTDLEFLDLSRNRLTGKIPKCLWNLSLKVVLLSSNRLCGAIPSLLGRNPSLVWLQLNDNNFNGELPQDFGYFTSLTVLDLGENKISGSIPERIGVNDAHLIILRLHKNNFTGRIPHSLCKCFYLQLLDLAHNNLTGSIPPCFEEFEAMKEDPLNTYTAKTGFDFTSGSIMQVLKGIALEYTKTLELVKNMDLSSNQLFGKIPEALTTLEALVGLNLSYNHFTGDIPKKIGNMKSLNSLDFKQVDWDNSFKHDRFEFLKSLKSVTQQLVRTNSNRKSITLIDPSIYANNPYLCGKPLSKECTPRENTTITTSNKIYKNDNEPSKVWFYLNITCGFATGFWGIIGVLWLKKQWRHKLFMLCEEAIDNIYIAVAIRVLKMKRG
ncbi:LOW QUALITY PROTEIN: hypothetical protein M8C21_028381 [Ambrosia artemisiifolia]|uniref:Leucine-rich repeat-containing N-terminal plant-type domain-containing protein n=1 Tax=Ambrosia artemisiifolia TaxID=4212 RepID=A0AAD5BT63_AMBAR|nr:LOW QUALITY PROTEIN: hypothetical protein M8C21_028381 [Ambrosia artemisiifolia]